MKKYAWILLMLVVLGSLIIEFLLPHESHHVFWFTGIPIFWIFFGFTGCTLMILFAKKILALIVYKKEDYYE